MSTIDSDSFWAGFSTAGAFMGIVLILLRVFGIL